KPAPIEPETPVPPPRPGAAHVAPTKPELRPPVAPDLPKLACAAGTAQLAAPFPDPTWYCALPDGTKDGPFVTLFPNYQPAIEGPYKDNKVDGAWKGHYASGALAEEGAYAAGLPDGAWHQLDLNGNALGDYKLKAGTGRQKRWLDDGSLFSDISLRRGVRH